MSRYLSLIAMFVVAACGGGGSGPDDDDDKKPGHLYVVSQADRAVYVYDIAADGSFSGPSRTITGAATGITNPTSMIVDGQGAIYVLNYQTNVVVFAADASGDATPIHTIESEDYPVYIANNGTSGYLLILNKASNDASQATTFLGSIYPAPAVPGAFVSFEIPFMVPNQRSIATSPIPNTAGWSVWTCSGVQPVGSSGSALCYGNPVTSNDAHYVTSPTVGVPATPNALDFRSDGALVVANQLAYMSPSNITTWALPGENNTTPPSAPLSVIKGDATGLVSPVHVYVDKRTDTIYVADTGNASYQGSVKTWRGDADGNVAPTRALTGLNYPFAIAVGP